MDTFLKFWKNVFLGGWHVQKNGVFQWEYPKIGGQKCGTWHVPGLSCGGGGVLVLHRMDSY